MSVQNWGMSTQKDGGPAFPGMVKVVTREASHGKSEIYHTEYTQGISMRDYFAGQALARREPQLPASVQAAEAYAIADAMLAAREQKE